MEEKELHVIRNQKDTVFRMLYRDKEKLLELYNALNGTDYQDAGELEIPVPRFVVFYNGTADQPERRVLKLSDAFEKKVASPELELKVLMLNINLGNNRELMEKCRTLKEYCMFVECIRKHKTCMEISEAVDRAVTECIQKNILADFLTTQRAEVVAMSIFEYNQEEEMKKIRAAEYSVGEEAGIEKGRALGREEGKAEGKAEGRAEAVLELLEVLGEVPVKLQERILAETDLDTLKKWLRITAGIRTVQDFIGETKLFEDSLE